MMWDRVIARLLEVLLADAKIDELFGDRIRMTGSGESPTPRDSLLEFMLIADTEREIDAPCVIQFDVWAPTMDATAAGERRLRQLFNRELPVDYGEGPMWAQYVDGSTLASPNRDGFSGRGVRFRFTPLRERYARLAPS